MKNKEYTIQYYDEIYRCWRNIPRLTFLSKEAAESSAILYKRMMNRTVRIQEIKND